jgi:DNA-binding NarL/FixJ family response regulator
MTERGWHHPGWEGLLVRLTEAYVASESNDVIRVVIADDVEDIRTMLRAILELDGRFEVVGEAGDGEEAVRLCGQLRPDVLVLDLAMPVMDGLEAIPRVRRGSPKTKILVLSGFDPRLGAKALELSADAYEDKSKPLNSLPSRIALVHAVV